MLDQSKTLIMKIKLNHIAVHVADLDRASRFYGVTIGLREIEEPFKDGLHAWFEMGEGISIHLIEELHLSPPTEKSKTNHLCFSVADMEAFIQKLNAAKWPFENWAGEVGKIHVRPDGIRQIFFRDPDGYWLEVNDDWT